MSQQRILGNKHMKWTISNKYLVKEVMNKKEVQIEKAF